MLRSISSWFAATVLLTLSGMPGSHATGINLSPAVSVADGTDPIAPPYPLAAPGRMALPQVADGTDPIAPPYPLAAPEKLTLSV